MFMINTVRVYNYTKLPYKTEVASIEQFRCFKNVWVEFIYNITYRRACVNSFGVLYFILKLWKSGIKDVTFFKKLINYLKILMSITARLI